jgi:hypothetical protein
MKLHDAGMHSRGVDGMGVYKVGVRSVGVHCIGVHGVGLQKTRLFLCPHKINFCIPFVKKKIPKFSYLFWCIVLM